ncbi:MAG TPA: AbrB/MazE/SpoVT family DNA-binding domain-containing protein [Coriobacteriia bacterium]
MKVKARKVGNSLTVTIPKDVVAEMYITADTDLNVFVREGAVVMEPVVSRWDRLIARMRAQAAESGTTEADVFEAIAEIRAEAAARRRAAEAAASDDDAS